MSKTITSASEIPAAMFYVTATDSFMSHWGIAEGRTNRVILPCADATEAGVVEENTRNRSDMKNVRVCAHKPRLHSHTLYSLFDRSSAPRWYEPGGFARKD